MEKNKDGTDAVLYQKDLEERVEALQTKLDAECEAHAADNKKYKKVFHQLLMDTQHVADAIRYMEKNVDVVEERGDGDPNVLLDITAVKDIVKELSAFHDKYSDKGYAFLKDIIGKE